MFNRYVVGGLVSLLVPMSALAQDDKPLPPPQVEEKKVVVIEEMDEDGNKTRIVLEGDDADKFDLDDLKNGKLDKLHKKLGKKFGKMKLKLGEDFDFDFDFSEGFDPEGFGHELHGKLDKVFKRTMGGEFKLPNMKDLMDPAKRKKWIEKITKRAKQREATHERDAAIKALGLDGEANKDEAAVIVPLLDDVLKAKRAAAKTKKQGQAKLKKALATNTDPKKAKELVKAYRQTNADRNKTLATSREKLRELLTVKQELKLVLRNVLD